MTNPKTKSVIAYIYDGYADCSLEPGCFMREDPLASTDWVCRHTLDPEHAKNELCEDPENYPERFVLGNGVEIDYYEKLPGEEL